jgi:hypothetical protein
MKRPVWSEKVRPVTLMSATKMLLVSTSQGSGEMSSALAAAAVYVRGRGPVFGFFVDRMLERWAWLWPRMVARERGPYLAICAAVRAGQVLRLLFLWAQSQVEMVGENSAAW